MNRIIKALILKGKARVTLIDTKEAVTEAIKIHNLSPLASAIMGRTLTAGAYLVTNLKDKAKFSMIIKGGGAVGSVVIAGESGNRIRGFLSNPYVNLPLREDGKLNVGEAVGNKGQLSVIIDYGLKEPYRGNSELVSGEIGEDFAYYLLKSQGIKSAVILGVRVDKKGVMASGGIIIEAMPGIEEEQLVIIEDIVNNLSNISLIMQKKTIEEIFDYYFKHLDGKILGTEELHYTCNCSPQRMESIIKGLSKQEVYDIIKEQGKLEIACQFCGKKYTYGKKEIENLWER